jgi:hypothetical protein
MTIDPSGNVGIGQTTPTYTLDVNGIGHFTKLVDAASFVATSSTATSTFAGGFTVGGSQFVVQWGSGNVGIGTTSPAYPLDVNGNVRFNSSEVLFPASAFFYATSTATPRIGWGVAGNRHISYIFLEPDNVTTSTTTEISTNSSGGTLKIGAGVNVRGGMIDFNGGSAAQNAGTLIFRSGASNGAVDSPERARFDITGNFGIGTTSPYSRLTLWGPDTAGTTAALTISNSASTTELQVFDDGHAVLNGALTQSSDQRLKTNITGLNASSSLAAIDALYPVTFNWIDPTEGTTPQLGFIAQQVQQVFPTLVSTTSATALTPGGTLGLNYIGLISPIVAAIQALDKEITSLTATVAGFATIFHTQELCVGDTCVTPAQFQAMVAAATQSSAGGTQPAVQISAPTPIIISGTSTPPTIDIQGDNPAIIKVGASYSDLGAIVTDNQGHSLGYRTFLNGLLVGTITLDTSGAATDTIDYVASDTWGNTATSTRTVIVEAVASSALTPPPASPADASSTATSTAQ